MLLDTLLLTQSLFCANEIEVSSVISFIYPSTDVVFEEESRSVMLVFLFFTFFRMDATNIPIIPIMIVMALSEY